MANQNITIEKIKNALKSVLDTAVKHDPFYPQEKRQKREELLKRMGSTEHLYSDNLGTYLDHDTNMIMNPQFKDDRMRAYHALSPKDQKKYVQLVNESERKQFNAGFGKELEETAPPAENLLIPFQYRAGDRFLTVQRLQKALKINQKKK